MPDSFVPDTKDSFVPDSFVPDATPTATAPAQPAAPTKKYKTVAGPRGLGTRVVEDLTATEVAKQTWQDVNKPIIPATKLTKPLMEKAPQVPLPITLPGGSVITPTVKQVAAVAHGAAGVVEDTSSPLSLGMMAAMAPLIAPSSLARFAPHAVKALKAADLGVFPFMNAIGFTGDMAYKSYQRLQGAKELWKQGKTDEAISEMTAALGDATMAAALAAHTGKKFIADRAPNTALKRHDIGWNAQAMDEASLANKETAIRADKDLTPEDAEYLLAKVERTRERLAKSQPVAGKPVIEKPAPGTLATGPFPGPQQPAISIRQQVGAPMQPPLGAPPETPSPQAQAFDLIMNAGKPVGPKPPTLPGVNLPRAQFNPNGPILDIQRRGIFAIANDRAMPKEVVEIVAGKKISQLTAGEARDLMTRLKNITPAEIKAVTPVAETPLLDAAKKLQEAAASAAPPQAPTSQAIATQVPPPTPEPAPIESITIGPRKAPKIDPAKSAVNAIRHLGFLDPERIKKAGLWTDFVQRVPPDIRRDVLNSKGGKHGLDTLGGEMENLGYPGWNLPDEVIENLSDPKKARAGHAQMAEAKELEQAKAHIQELERRLSETEFNPEDFTMAGEEGKPPIREPGEEGFARLFDFKPKEGKESANELRLAYYDLLNKFDKAVNPEERSALLKDIVKAKIQIALAERPGEVVKGPWKGEEGWARYRDDKTGDLFPEDFILRAAGVRPKLPEQKPATIKPEAPAQPRQLPMEENPLLKIIDEKATEKPAGLPEPFRSIVEPAKETARDYDSVQKEIDAFEDQLIGKYGSDAVAKAPAHPEIYTQAGLKPPESSIAANELAKLTDLYRERDAIDKAGVENFVRETSKRFESLIPDETERTKFVRKITEADLPAALRAENNPESWRATGDLANAIVHHLSEKMGDPPQTAFKIRATIAGTADNPKMQLRMTTEHGLGPSTRVLNEAQRWMNELFHGADIPQIPGATTPKRTALPEPFKQVVEKTAPVEPEEVEGKIYHLPAELAEPLERILGKPKEKPRPVSEAAGQFAQSEVDRRATVAREAIMRVVQGKGTWAEKRRQLGLDYKGQYYEVPISRPEIEAAVKREMAETVQQTGLKPTSPEKPKPAAPKPSSRSLFGDEEGYARLLDESSAKPMENEEIPGAGFQIRAGFRDVDKALARDERTAPVVKEIYEAHADRQRWLQKYDDTANDIIKKSGIKKGSAEDEMVKDLLDQSFTALTPEKLRQSKAYRGDKEAAITAAERLRKELFDPIINQIRNDPELVSIIGKRGYIRGYFPHFEQMMRQKYGKYAPGMMKAMLPESFLSRFLKEREMERWVGNVSIFDVIPAYLHSTAKTVHDLPAYARAMKIIKELPDGASKGIAEWYARNYIGDPTINDAIQRGSGKYEAVSRWIAQRQYDALIGLNYRTWAVNLGQNLNTITQVGLKNWIKGAEALFTKEGRQQFHDTGILLEQPGLESGIELHGRIRKAMHIGMGAGEYVNRGIAYHAGLAEAQQMGLVGKAAEMHALETVRETQFSYGKESPNYRIQRASPHMRVFQTYPSKQGQFMRDVFQDGIQKGIMQGDRQARARMVRLIIILGGVPAAASAAGVSLTRAALDLGDIVPGMPVPLQALDKAQRIYRDAKAGRLDDKDGNLDPSKISDRVLKDVVFSFLPGANFFRNISRDTGLVPARKAK